MIVFYKPVPAAVHMLDIQLYPERQSATVPHGDPSIPRNHAKFMYLQDKKNRDIFHI